MSAPINLLGKLLGYPRRNLLGKLLGNPLRRLHQHLRWCARRRHRRHDDSGSVSAELVLLTPILILLLVFVVALGRLASARGEVDGAAAQAARAASLTRDPGAAIAAAKQSAASELSSQHVTCAHLGVGVDTSQFDPGGWVAVTVTCNVDLADLLGLRLPVKETISSRAVSVIDRFRVSTQSSSWKPMSGMSLLAEIGR